MTFCAYYNAPNDKYSIGSIAPEDGADIAALFLEYEGLIDPGDLYILLDNGANVISGYFLSYGFETFKVLSSLKYSWAFYAVI